MNIQSDSALIRIAVIADAARLNQELATPGGHTSSIRQNDSLISFYSPDGSWIYDSDLVLVTALSDLSILHRCVETAWRNFKPVLLLLNNDYAESLDEDGWDLLQDTLDKANLTLFLNPQLRQTYLDEAFQLGAVGVLPASQETAENAAAFYLRLAALQGMEKLYRTFAAENSERKKKYLAAKTGNTIYLDVSTLLRMKDYNGLPHFLMVTIMSLNRIYADRLQFVSYNQEKPAFNLLKKTVFLAALAHFPKQKLSQFNAFETGELKHGSCLLLLTGNWLDR